MSYLEDLLHDINQMTEEGQDQIDSRLVPIIEKAKPFYVKEYYQYKEKSLERLAKEIAKKKNNKKTQNSEIKQNLESLVGERFSGKDQFLERVKKQIGAEATQEWEKEICKFAYFQDEIIDILEAFEERFFDQLPWDVIRQEGEESKIYNQFEDETNHFREYSKEKAMRYFLNGFLEYYLNHYQVTGVELQTQLDPSNSDLDREDGKNSWLIQTKDFPFSQEVAWGYLEFRKKENKTPGQAPKTCLNNEKNKEKYWNVFSLPQLVQYYYQEIPPNRQETHKFPFLGELKTIPHPKKNELHHTHITNTIGWLEYLYQKTFSQGSSHSNQGNSQEKTNSTTKKNTIDTNNPERTTMDFISDVEHLRQEAQKDNTVFPVEITELILRIQKGVKWNDLLSVEREKLNKFAGSSPRLVFLLRQAQLKHRAEKRRLRDMEVEEIPEKVVANKKKESFSAILLQGLTGMLQSLWNPIPLAGVAIVMVALFVLIPQYFTDKTDFYLYSKQVAVQLTENGNRDLLKKSLSLRKIPENKVYGFDQNLSLHRAAFRLGVNLVDLEILLKTGSQEKSLALLEEQLALFPSFGQSSLNFDSEYKQLREKVRRNIFPSPSEVSTKKIEELLDQKDLSFEFRLGEWVEGARLASITKYSPYFSLDRLEYFLGNAKGKIPRPIIARLKAMQGIIKKGNFTPKETQELLENAEKILSVLNR